MQLRALVVVVVGWGWMPLALAQDAPTHPNDYAVSARTSVAIGNSTRIVRRIPSPDPDLPPTDVPVAVASGGSLALDERAFVGDVVARTALRTKLLAEIHGVALVPHGSAQLGPQTHVDGDLLAKSEAIVGLDAIVDGDVAATDGDVKIVRLAVVRGDVYSHEAFKGDRDIVVGSDGSRVDLRRGGTIRDRGEYFGAVYHAGPIHQTGNGAATFHAGMTEVEAGALVVPALPSWQLERLAVPSIDAGPRDVRIERGGDAVVLRPGVYRRLEIEQDATVALRAGAYVFEEVLAGSDARIDVDLEDGTLTIDVAKKMQLGRRVRMRLGTSDEATRQARAARIRTWTGDGFRLDQDGVWAGAVYAKKSVILGKHVQLHGTTWSDGTVAIGRDSTVVWVTPSLGE